MQRLTEEQIKDINAKADWDQGIFREPWGIDNREKDLVIYQRYSTGGVSGGSCWESSDPQPYTSNTRRPRWIVLDETLKILCPDISYMKYKEIEDLVIDSEHTKWEYYGNSEDYAIYYLPLERLYRYLNI